MLIAIRWRIQRYLTGEGILQEPQFGIGGIYGPQDIRVGGHPQTTWVGEAGLISLLPDAVGLMEQQPHHASLILKGANVA